jgi:hypothetical protein
MAKLKVVFMFVASDADPGKHKTIISTPEVLEILVIGVKDYQQAAQEARDLADRGYKAIELCGGFGNLGVSIVAQAVGDKAVVGVIRFDCHPSLGCKSGDEINMGSACVRTSHNYSTI